MLVLTRHPGQKVTCRCACGCELTVEFLRWHFSSPREKVGVRLGFTAPLTTLIWRDEVGPLGVGPVPPETPVEAPPAETAT